MIRVKCPSSAVTAMAPGMWGILSGRSSDQCNLAMGGRIWGHRYQLRRQTFGAGVVYAFRDHPRGIIRLMAVGPARCLRLDWQLISLRFMWRIKVLWFKPVTCCM